MTIPSFFFGQCCSQRHSKQLDENAESVTWLVLRLIFYDTFCYLPNKLYLLNYFYKVMNLEFLFTCLFNIVFGMKGRGEFSATT